MLVSSIIIYVILVFFLGPMWPFEMFSRGGCLGQIFALAWVALLVGGLNY